MIEPRVRRHIVDLLHQVSIEEGVRILFAVESGSRAWGFASPDSDYDVRFVYVHPRDWYLRLEPGRDVVERPLDQELVDLAGWDVQKALRLLLRSNPPLYEWLCSPIVYVDDGLFRNQARLLFEAHASPRKLAHHYHSIAKGQWRAEIDGRDCVRLKKYFYVLRPLLSLQWVASTGTSPPMEMQKLLAESTLPEILRDTIGALIEAKRIVPETGRKPRLPILDDWASERLETLNPAALDLPDHVGNASTQMADDLFLATIDPISTKPPRDNA